MTPLVWLEVPFAENAAVKRLGARWSARRKAWYVPRALDPEAFQSWRRGPVADPGPDPVSAFAAFLAAAGVRLEAPPLVDGDWHRVALVDDRGAKRSASYRGFLDGRPNGCLMNFRAGERTDWLGEKVPCPEAKAAARAEAADRLEHRRLERLARQRRAAARAARIWTSAVRLSPGPAGQMENVYLRAKGISGHGVRMDMAGRLIVPARDILGRLHSLLFIDAAGAKRFLKDGRKAGLMHAIDAAAMAPAGVVFIAEGYATAASVHEASGLPAIAAFDAGNLAPVAQALRDRHRGLPIIIAADDDHGREGLPGGNVGLLRARQAADAVGGIVLAPPFDDDDRAGGLTDWNDYILRHGPKRARRQLKVAVEDRPKR